MTHSPAQNAGLAPRVLAGLDLTLERLPAAKRKAFVRRCLALWCDCVARLAVSSPNSDLKDEAFVVAALAVKLLGMRP